MCESFDLYLALRDLLESWLQARLRAVRARTEREEQLLLQQQHILEGSTKAAKHSREIVDLLQRCRDAEEVVSKLMGRQADACTIAACAYMHVHAYMNTVKVEEGYIFSRMF